VGRRLPDNWLTALKAIFTASEAAKAAVFLAGLQAADVTEAAA